MEWRVVGQFVDGQFQALVLAQQKFFHGPVELGVAKPVKGVCGVRKKAATQFMFALRPCFKAP
jgi:hypothetical protein